MTLLLSTFGGYELMLTIIMLLIIGGVLRFFFRSATKRSAINTVRKESKELQDTQYP